MRALEFAAEIDEARHLQITLPSTAAPGPVRVLVLLPDPEQGEDAAEAAWATGLAHEWAADWSDPGEDIYRLTDGVDAHAAR